MDPIDKELKEFFDKRPAGEEREFARKAAEALRGAETEGAEPPAGAVARARALFPVAAPLSCPHCSRPITPFRKPIARQKLWGALWFGIAAAAFALSFAVPRYFVQCLVVALLAGIKGIMDAKTVKTQVLVYKALAESGESSSRVGDLQKPSSRL